MSDSSSHAIEYVSTGIAGLNEILHGGFLRAGLYLVQGEPGTGKTTLALQFLRERHRQGDPTLYFNLTESKEDMERAARSHGWSLEGIPIRDLSTSDSFKTEAQYTIFHPYEVELSETTQAILSEIERIQPAYVVFDGLSEVRLLAGDPLRYRRQMLALKQYFAEKGITALLLDDRSGPIGPLAPESLVGGNILLEDYTSGYGRARRRLRVTKVRGSDFTDGYHDYEITGEGMVVYPRLVAAGQHAPISSERVSSNVAGLDAMLQGGLEPGTTTLILGPAGVGKSTVAFQYAASAVGQGHHAVVYAFEEVARILLGRAEKLCGPIVREAHADGRLHVQQVDTAEMSPGQFAEAVRRSVLGNQARVIVIDSLNGYVSSMLEEKMLAMHLHELFAFLNQQGVVTVVVAAQHGLINAREAEVEV
ncbi:MAG TPA: ATPase domain-containing protein, partial [Chthonomonadaceae bacterium]|nr:ATPase domain-containing protein [Chthonomonadaceae bacterium]